MDNPEQRLTITTSKFEEQLKFLKDHGYSTVSFDQLSSAFNGQFKLPAKPIILSFDDGTTGHYSKAYPLLKKYGFKGTFFVNTSFIGKEDHLTEPQIKEMHDGGMEISSHSATHPDLTKITAEKLAYELTTSKKKLEELTGSKVEAFAYPSGFYNDSVIQAVKSAGYKTARTISNGLYEDPKKPFEIKSYSVGKDTVTVDMVSQILGESRSHTPRISNVKKTNVTDKSVTLSWVTDTKSRASICYSTKNFTTWGKSCPNKVEFTTPATSHTKKLTGLTKATTYNFRIAALHVADSTRLSSVRGSFTTPNSDDSSSVVYRISGTDRYGTAIRVSKAIYPTVSATAHVPVVLTTGENWPDAFAGTALARKLNGSLLMTKRDNLPATVLAEIKRLKPTTVYILGSNVAVSDTVANTLKNNNFGVVRYSGADRVETAALIADQVVKDNPKTSAGKIIVDTVFIAPASQKDNSHFPDAGIVAPVSAAKKFPVFYVRDTIPTETKKRLDSYEVKRYVIIGGEVSEAVKTALGAKAVRIAGKDRYETATKFADWAKANIEGITLKNVALVNGTKFADYIAASNYISRKSGIVLLTDAPGTLKSETKDYLTKHKAEIQKSYVFGGNLVMSYNLFNQVVKIFGK
jgi:peptidoglycan/xylan/chitin deacetylase (PgdA/CDA1 family)/putative cell wall-binding protein